VSSALVLLLGVACIVHFVAHYPTRGDQDIVSGFGVALSSLAAIMAAASSPRRRLPLLLGSLGIGFMWYMGSFVPPPVVMLRGDTCLASLMAGECEPLAKTGRCRRTGASVAALRLAPAAERPYRSADGR
jgi:hypothetical protein